MNKALFLDRDGIINIDKGYIHKPEDVEFCKGIFQFMKTASALGFMLFVITNQAGVARGMYEEADVTRLHEWMDAQIKKHGINIKKYYHCPHHPEFTGACSCRKPETGMVEQAASEYGIDLSSSVIIGDKKSDVRTGKNAGMAYTILVSGKYEQQSAAEADFFASDLYEAEKALKAYCEA